jgi:hypothetical protein
LATKTIKISDLTGTEIGTEERMARLVIEEHPDLSDSVTLEVLPEEVEDKLPQEANYVKATYFPPSVSGETPRTFVLTLEELNNLSPERDMETVLTDAYRAQQEEEGRRRVRRGRRQGGKRRPRRDFTSPEHAGEPHRGRVSDEEKQYVRENLDAVNARLREKGLPEIDPTDPEMTERYGLTPTAEDTVEEELQG